MKLIRTLLATLLLSVFFTLPQQGFADIKLNGKPISSANGGIKLDSNEDGTVDVIVANDGKLGIGETSPSANLHVSGNVYISGNITLADSVEYSGSGKPNDL